MFLLIDNHTDSALVPLLRNVLDELGLEHQVVAPDAELAQRDLADVIGIVLSRDIDASAREKFVALLDEIDVPLLGIGSGAHFIVQAYSGRIGSLHAPANSRDTIELANQCMLFDFLPDSIDVAPSTTSFIDGVPSGFEVVAKSKAGHALAVQHETREIYALLIDPVDAGRAGHSIVGNFMRYAGTFSGAI